ncbi:MAG: TonB-dependent receptor, partial [Sphingomonadaceae bacterium]
SWRGGVSYKTSNRGLVYATISKGYKAGSFPTGASTQDVQYRPVKQESLLAYEIGFKQPLIGNKLQLVGAGFYYDYKGKQLRGRLIDIAFGPLDALVQIPKSRVWGFEGQIIAQPFRGYNINVATTYVNTKIQKFIGFNAAGTTQDYAGSRFPYAPKWQIVADNQYDFDLNNSLSAFVGGSLTYNGSTNASIGYPGDYKIPAYTLLGVRAGVKAADDSWTFQLWGRNITNKYYWTNVVLFDDALVKYAGRPVSYGASFGYRF